MLTPSLIGDTVSKPFISMWSSVEANEIISRPNQPLTQIHRSGGLGLICDLHFPLKNHCFFLEQVPDLTEGKEIETAENCLDLGNMCLGPLEVIGACLGKVC